MKRILLTIMIMVMIAAFFPGSRLHPFASTAVITINLPVTYNGTTGNVYYVSPSGNDSNPGTITKPWKTPWKAGSTAQAGDIVYFRGGVYYGQLTPKNSGNLSKGWISFLAYPREEPVLIHDAYWSRPVNIDGVSFIAISGLTAVSAGQNGPGIGINNAHHIRITHSTVRNSATSGIATTNGIDYITIENNRIYSNSNVGTYNGSGISIWSSGGPIYDSGPGYHIIIRSNLIYDNRNLTDTPTDGNGIIFDNNDHGSTPDLQSPKALIANNVIFNNGGRCIHLLNTSNADVVHNTCYQNLQTQRIQEGCNGEITLQRTTSSISAVNIRVYNNVVYGKGGTCNNGRDQAYVFQVFCSQGCPQYTSDYNLWYNGAVEKVGLNDLIDNPDFVSPSLNPAAANFALLSVSPAVDSGTALFIQFIYTDLLGRLRPQGGGLDLGAYESH